MRKKMIPAEEILADMYIGLNKDILRWSDNRLTLDDIVQTHKVFRFINNTFIFAPRKNSPIADTKHASPYYIREDGEFILGDMHIRTYRRVLPFMKFHLSEYDEWTSGWYKTKQLYEILPSRRNIIDNLLKTL